MFCIEREVANLTAGHKSTLLSQDNDGERLNRAALKHDTLARLRSEVGEKAAKPQIAKLD